MLLYKAQTTDTYTYDAAGRQTQTTNPSPPNYGAQPQYATRAYDAENHVVSQAYTGPNEFYCYKVQMCNGTHTSNDPMADMPTGTTMTYGLGPNGHPLVIAGQPNPTFTGTITNTIHWDGDDVLFTVDSSGNVELRAGELAMMMTSTGLDVLDRDMTGGLVGDHDSQGFSGWSAAPSFNTGKLVTAHGSFPVGSDSGNSGQFMQNRLDGYNDGYGNTFQGVRSQDSNTGQWSTPDAYAGDVHDPMSQKPYMYNHNNPLQYGDPSGYVPVAAGAAAGGTIVCIVLEPCGAGEAVAGGIAGAIVGIGITVGLVWKAFHRDGPGQATRPGGVPGNWAQGASRSGRGTTWTQDSYNNVRFEPGDPNRKDPNERGPFFKVKINGKSRDASGKPVSDSDPAAHIKPGDFDFGKITEGASASSSSPH